MRKTYIYNILFKLLAQMFSSQLKTWETFAWWREETSLWTPQSEAVVMMEGCCGWAYLYLDTASVCLLSVRLAACCRDQRGQRSLDTAMKLVERRSCLWRPAISYFSYPQMRAPLNKLAQRGALMIWKIWTWVMEWADSAPQKLGGGKQGSNFMRTVETFLFFL